MPSATRFARDEMPSLAGMAGAALLRQVVSEAYEKRRGGPPPTDPSLDGVRWRDAVVWTVVMAAGAAVGRLVMQYAVGEAVNRATGQRQSQGA